MLQLRLSTQSYDWGVPASQDSKVLSLARANGVAEATKVDDQEKRFGELWVGTHPNGASKVVKGGKDSATLEQWLEHHPEALGRILAEMRGVGQPQGRLPFLMKVLSIDKALPLQAHPTSSAAQRMHKQNPEMYPDFSHKPEMVICLSSFCGFAGFLTFDKMSQLLGRMPQLTEVLGPVHVQQYLEAGPANGQARQKALAAMFSHLLLRTPQEVAAQILDLVLKRLEAQQQGTGASLLPASTQTTQAAASKDGSGSSSHNIRFSAHDVKSHPISDVRTSDTDPSASAGVKVPTTGTSSAETAAEAVALSGPEQPAATACDMALALGVVSQPGTVSQRDAMLLTAARAWPGDAAGVLALLLMEDVVLQQGEALLIPAGCPHVYVCGEMLEVQAASNNTIKGGLTAPEETHDKQGLVDIVTGGILSEATGGAAVSQDTPASGDQESYKMFEGLPPFIAATAPGGVLPQGSVEGLRLYQPPVQEFQVLHVSTQAGQKPIDLVVDPGPATLLVLNGAGNAVVKAGVVVDEGLQDEVELHPGTALFIPAGSSMSIAGSSSTDTLDVYMTTANSRLFTAAPSAGAAATTNSDACMAHVGAAVERNKGQVEQSGADPGAVFTSSEQVAAAVMAGATGTHCHVHDAERDAPVKQEGAAMETD